MSVTISPAPVGSAPGVVNVGDEISQNQLNAITGASAPTASNVFVTNNALTGTTRTFTTAQVFRANSSSAASIRVLADTGDAVSTNVGAFYVSVLNPTTNGHAVVIENRGGGDCLRIHDQTADDPTKFVVDAAGNVTLGGALNLVSTAVASAVGAQTYPDELTIRCNGSTYRIPARLLSTP